MAALIRRLGVGALAAALLASTSAVAATPNLEQAVKANFLYKFAPFVTWPPQPGGAGAPFQVCIAGADPFGGLLDSAVRGQRIGDRPILVRRMPRVQGASGCHIVFLGNSEGQPLGEMLRALHGQPVLTVTDEQSGAADSVIRFVVRGGRVRFAINRASARDSGLTISSKLLDLAIAVEN